MRRMTLAIGLLAGGLTACPAERKPLDTDLLLKDVEVLAADSMEGRYPGTPGSERARRYLLPRFAEAGIEPFGEGYEQFFTFRSRREQTDIQGVNLVGSIRGSRHPGRYIVVTAHYDHLGVRNGEIYNGADDNASGVAGLLAVAAAMKQHPPDHTFVFLAADAEEQGLRGARAFMESPPVPLDSIVLNINLDMISRSERDELYAVGTYHYPFLRPFIETVAERAPVTLLKGHDRPDQPGVQDWTHSSDHAVFHRAGIPFVYFGVEDHPDYHRPTDIFENIAPDFFIRSVKTILDAVRELDAGMDAVEVEERTEPAASFRGKALWPLAVSAAGTREAAPAERCAPPPGMPQPAMAGDAWRSSLPYPAF